MIRAPRLHSSAQVVSGSRKPVASRARKPRENPDESVVINGTSPEDVTLFLRGYPEPSALQDGLFRKLTVFVGNLAEQRFGRISEVVYLVAGCALAYMRIRFSFVRDGLVDALNWPSDETKVDYLSLATRTLKQSRAYLVDKEVDINSLETALRRALAESFSHSPRRLSPAGVGALFYVEALMRELRWESDVGGEMSALMRHLYRREMTTVPERAALHFAYIRGEELFNANGQSHVNPFNTIGTDVLDREFVEYLNEDVREYRKRDANASEREFGLMSFKNAQQSAEPFILDPFEVDSIKPFRA